MGGFGFAPALLVGVSVAAITAAGPAQAQVARATQQQAFDIPEQDAAGALDTLMRQTRLPLVWTASTVERIRTRPVRGTMTPRAALDAMLADTGVAVVQTADGGLTLRRAQDVADTEDGAAIIVTGSRLARSPLDTPSPVQTVTAEDLETSGEVELAEALAEFPAISSDLNSGTVTGNVQNSGLDVVALRNLGNNRTLVLIDGRRTVSNSGIGNLVSLNTIPTDFVERIEVITGGASSVYGSDAVAGVVNIITETNQTGFRVGARAGVAEGGDAQERTFTASWGTRFADDRGYAFVSGTYDQDVGLRSTDRDFATREFQYRYSAGINEIDTVFVNPGSGAATNVPTSGFRPASTFPPNIPRDLSSLTPGGVFYGQSSARDRFYGPGGLVPIGRDVQTGAVVPIGTSDDGNSGFFLPNRDGFNQRTGRELQIPRERYLLAGKLTFALTERVDLFAQAQYSRIDTLETREPVGLAFDDVFLEINPATGIGSEVTIGRIPCRRATGTGSGACNPFVPADLRADVSTNGTGVAFQRRFSEVGDQIYENTRDTIRSWAGGRAELGNGWNLEMSVGYGRYEQTQLRRNAVIGRRLQAGLNAEIGPDGQPRCVDAAARAAGCVPVNLFGEGAISQAAADYLRADVRQDLTVEQLTGQAFVTGTLAQLPAGPLNVAVGAEYRRDRQDLRGDDFAQFGGTTENVVPDFSGSIRAIEGFAEASVPILAEVPGAELLSVDGSVRVANYDIDRVGTVFSYRVGGQYAPVRDIRFRAQYARSQRAPDLSELFSPPRGDFDTVADICDGVRPGTAGTIAANCRAEPGIQAALAAQAAAGQLQEFDAITSIYSPNAGNSGVKEETADTITLGAVFQPRFLPRFTLSVDYYSIKIKDAIDSYTNEDLLRLCYDNAVARAANPFCADISRNPNNGQISQIIQREVNVAGFDVEGIDVAADWRFSLDDMIGLPGRWQLRYTATHLLRQDFRFVGLNGVETADRLGELASRTFKYRARGSLDYKLDGVTLRYSATYFGKIRDSNTRLAAYEALLETNPAAEYPLFLDIGDVWEHDVYAGIDVRPGFRFYAGVNNLFDRVSPFLPTGTTSGRLTNINTAYDIVGRRFYAGVRVDF